MKRTIARPEFFWPGVIYGVIGLLAVLIGQNYRMGTAGHMGPAYFPTILGSLLVLIGAVCVARSFFGNGEALGKFAVKEAALVLAGTALFGLLIRNAGFIPATMVLILVGGYASARFRIVPYLILAAGITTFCVLVFIKGLGLPMPIFGPWSGF